MIILKRDPVLGLQTYIGNTKKEVKKCKDVPISVPITHNPVYMRYNDWVEKYKVFLMSYIDELWLSMYDAGIIVDYTGFTCDLLRCLYKTSASRYSNFTFLST